jgi:transcriptional regulator with XRE-family HTH domain
MHIANNIKKVREFKDLTQEYVAQQLNISQVAYSKMERGETEISMSKLEQISKIFEVSITDLVNFDEKRVFFNITENKDQSTINAALILNNGLIEKERAMYEEMIKQLHSEITYLKKILDSYVK